MFFGLPDQHENQNHKCHRLMDLLQCFLGCPIIHPKNELCGGDGFFGKKNWWKIWPKIGLKWPKIA